ncbi:DUF1292 domain-containing protein [Oceanobacillus bengalensis]|uniref:DUF1292 domain-containing protein n=1 Tax=Oceanobacillus bengalensis TaxID=1435466 RepID=A0A494YZ42_9BACI|nr:DUF1292 domain-containing protein [Oceanobacillus bengalensis]RKQ15515.1 DUF1292 domain-containing protein [Oceanobacillus bengalensis]
MEEIKVGDVFNISDETEKEEEVEVLAKVTLQDTDYVAVCFVEDIKDDSEDDIDVFFLKIDDEGDLAAIETDEEFDKVSEAFDAILDVDDEEEQE